MSIQLISAISPSELDAFYALEQEVYASYPLHRSGSGDMLPLLIEGVSPYCQHASVSPYLIMRSDQPMGRFCFIQDHHLPDYIQVSWFEALPGLEQLAEAILSAAKHNYPQCKRIVIGLNAHLNYGAGFLLNRFEEAPIFELPYSPAYYRDYFADLTERHMFTFRYRMPEFYAWGDRQSTNLRRITVRNLSLQHLERDIGIYTELNNACFTQHPYWAQRSVEEDIELFRSLGAFLDPENLLFAEFEGKAVGFLFWLPDFNELLQKYESLGAEHLKQHQSGYQYRQYRFHEIAVRPGFRGPVSLALFLGMLASVKKLGCAYGEGGIIFAENQASLNMTKRYYQRVFGSLPEPWRRLAVYEAEL